MTPDAKTLARSIARDLRADGWERVSKYRANVIARTDEGKLVLVVAGAL